MGKPPYQEKNNIELGNLEKNDIKKQNPANIKAPDAWYGVRHTQILLMFLLLAIGYGMRVNLSVGIVAMTDPTINPGFTTYNWKDESIVLSSFFWGYILPQIPAGQFAKKYGARWFLMFAMLVGSIFTILIPVMASFGSWGVMLCRVIQGFTQGFFFPSIHTMLSKWAPVPERSRLGTFVFAGGTFGTVISMPVTGWICGSSLGWPAVFYLYGLVGIAWTIAFFFLGSNTPNEHKTISMEEKFYIQETLGTHSDIKHPTPWKSIVTSVPVWAILVVHCAQNWGFWTLLTELPTFMKNTLNFDIKKNGLLSACPYFTMWIMSFVFSAVTDYIINKELVTIGHARKIVNSIGLYIPALALFLLGFFGHGTDTTGMVLSFLIIAVGSNAAHMCGYQVNHIDLSPNHAGTLMGITNGFSNIFSLFGPLLVQFIVKDKHNVDQWKIVFFIASAIYIFGNTFFVIFGSGEIQSWNYDAGKEKQETDEAREKEESQIKKIKQ